MHGKMSHRRVDQRAEKRSIRMDQDPLFQAVPFGEENAATARQIWGVERVGAVGTVRHKLSKLAADGLIEKKHVKIRHYDVAHFFRKPD